MGKRKEPQVQEEIKVKLPNFLGIKPGVYLAFIYSFFILLIIFFIFFFPGISKNGSKVNLTSLPSGASVYLDGVYVGYTPLEIFIPRGKREISLRKEGFKELKVVESLRGRVFGSLFFPRKVSLNYSLDLSSKSEYLFSLLEEYSHWSSVAPYAENYQPPLIISEALAVLAVSGEISKEEGCDILYFLMNYINSETYLTQTISAAQAILSNGNPITPLGFIQNVDFFIKLQAKYKNIPFLLSSLLDEQAREVISETDISKYREKYQDLLEDFQGITIENRDRPVTLEDLVFIPFRGGEFIMGKTPFTESHSHPVLVKPFYLADRHITNAQYSRFLVENPDWNFRNKSTLMEKGYITEEYLNGFVPMKDPNKPVTYISYHAALAYCQWLQKKLPPSLNGYTIRLPREEEMEWAAVTSGTAVRVFGEKEGPLPITQDRSDENGVYDILGNLWVWCENVYSPAGYFLTSWEPSFKEPIPPLTRPPERVVRGGSWANNPRELDPQTRGSQPEAWCTPFVGFRPILVRN